MFLARLADAGAILLWIIYFCLLSYRKRPSGRHRQAWYRPWVSGLAIGWGGYFLRWWGMLSRSWAIYNVGSLVEIIGLLFALYGVITLLRIPKPYR